VLRLLEQPVGAAPAFWRLACSPRPLQPQPYLSSNLNPERTRSPHPITPDPTSNPQPQLQPPTQPQPQFATHNPNPTRQEHIMIAARQLGEMHSDLMEKQRAVAAEAEQLALAAAKITHVSALCGPRCASVVVAVWVNRPLLFSTPPLLLRSA